MPDAVPNYLTTEPDGSTSALFTGGVKIPAAVGVVTDYGKAVTWTAVAGEGLVAEITGHRDTNNILHQSFWRVAHDSGNDHAYLHLFSQLAFGASVTASVQQGANTASATLIGQSGNSSFIQSPNVSGASGANRACLEAVFGLSGGGFVHSFGIQSATRIAVGTYRLTCGFNANRRYAVAISTASTVTFALAAISGASFNIVATNPAGTPVDVNYLAITLGSNP